MQCKFKHGKIKGRRNRQLAGGLVEEELKIIAVHGGMIGGAPVDEHAVGDFGID